MDLMIWAAVLALGSGLAIKLLSDRMNSEYRLTWVEFAAGAFILLAVVIPSVYFVGQNLAKSNLLRYREYWSGYELSVQRIDYQCRESETEGGSTGGCVHTYNADPYEELEYYECGYWTGSGDDRHYVSQTCSRWVTRWRQVPYTSSESSYVVHTTLGDYTIGDHWLPDAPQEHRIRPRYGSPMQGLPSLPSGIPAFWQAAKDRIAAGTPGPVAARMEYDNYILATSSSILHRYSDSIDRYLERGLLPAVRSDIRPPYFADRVYYVGITVSDANAWSEAINRFDAAFGTDLQGDLHLVIVDANTITDPDNYVFSLAAYWQSPEMGRDALSKNGLVVIVGTADGRTVSWARSFTGMPVGNEELIIDLQRQLIGAALDPVTLLGLPRGEIYVRESDGKLKVRVIHDPAHTGVIEAQVWGPHKFVRICMVCDDEGETSSRSFTYLWNEIQPTSEQKALILFVEALATSLVWGLFLFWDAIRQNSR